MTNINGEGGKVTVTPDGVIKTALTAEEISAREARKVTREEERLAEEAAVAQLVIDKASAKAKLIAGEALTEAEADTIVL